jgi:hypothetical protein
LSLLVVYLRYMKLSMSSLPRGFSRRRQRRFGGEVVIFGCRCRKTPREVSRRLLPRVFYAEVARYLPSVYVRRNYKSCVVLNDNPNVNDTNGEQHRKSELQLSGISLLWRA